MKWFEIIIIIIWQMENWNSCRNISNNKIGLLSLKLSAPSMACIIEARRTNIEKRVTQINEFKKVTPKLQTPRFHRTHQSREKHPIADWTWIPFECVLKLQYHNWIYLYSVYQEKPKLFLIHFILHLSLYLWIISYDSISTYSFQIAIRWLVLFQLGLR